MITVRVTQAVTRLSGLAVLALGLLFWSGRALGLVPLHVALGIILVLALWTLSAIAFRAGVDRAAIAMAICWGIALPLLGFVQFSLPAGGGYGLVRVLHLVFGLGAIAQAESLAKHIDLRRASNTSSKHWG
jgi:hypothetical protein